MHYHFPFEDPVFPSSPHTWPVWDGQVYAYVSQSAFPPPWTQWWFQGWAWDPSWFSRSQCQDFCGSSQERRFVFPTWAVNLQLFETQSWEKQSAPRKHSYHRERIQTDRVSLTLFKHLDLTITEASHLSKLYDHKSQRIHFVGKASLRFNSLATKRILSNAKKRSSITHVKRSLFLWLLVQ